MRESLVPVVLMSHTAHIRSHRKPRRNASTLAMRAGVAGGVLSTLAVAGASGSANAAETTQTLDLSALTADLATQVAQSADATQQAAANYELQAERDAAAAKAAQQAKADLADAKAKAAAKKKAADEAARKAAAEEAASRSAERTTLSSSDSASTSVSAPASGSVATVIAFLKAQVGDAYVMGGTGPNSWDCSGLVQAAFKQAGVDLPRVSGDQSTAGTPVSLSNLAVGDILYWGSAGSAYHVGVYIGDGQYLDAANPSKGVVIQDLSGYPATGAVRVL
ncbi:C40 family peptidase [Streptomyces sp. NBC_00620]|uniref:C40 family peptidase n=1 Tax=unclassified Streptomyces TaxID=2593676 RepID=UPI00224E2DCA|nr:C40 family peptidase [Streptomyces sp. NBC_00620]MCX4972259.1 C40 family peptidase [Streptomyces sp. NBC_00620]WTB39095.1 C40 family peptidase [Streptomyces sp. NBC_00827]WUC13254.1 C40 family peptidase [Streptomyces sp. NBC_00564]WUC50236.1 C40 family peptidase [Streptomyces sp. NBC_00554]